VSAPRPRFLRCVALACAALLAIAAVQAASADGEAGVVIDYGGHVEAFCIGFTGESITGEQLLQRAGKDVGQVPPGLVCAIDGTGCTGAHDYNSCLCQCQGSNCVYWSFFQRAYGAAGWVYSAQGFRLARARDGDLHGWRWGAGTGTSAPPPAGVTFEQVCGHAPQGGATAATATSPPPSPTSPPPASPVPTPAGAAASTASPPAPTGAHIPPAVATPSAAPAATSPAITVTVVAVGTTLPPATGSPVETNDGSSRTDLAAFGIIVAALLAATGGALVWKNRRGARG
jgi:hypothetical protein